MEPVDTVWIEIGTRGSLTRAAAEHGARLLKEAMQVNLRPSSSRLAGIYPSIGGYEDDPRELFEIPEVRSYLCRWAQFAGIETSADAIAAKIHPHMCAILAKCAAFTDVDPDAIPVITEN